MGFGTWKRQLFEWNIKLWLQCRRLSLLLVTFVRIWGTHTEIECPGLTPDLQNEHLQEWTWESRFISNIVFLVVLQPGQAWEPVPQAVFQMRKMRPEKRLLRLMAESCLDLTSASPSAQGPSDSSPRPLGPLSTQEKLTDEAVCVCPFSSVLKR